MNIHPLIKSFFNVYCNYLNREWHLNSPIGQPVFDEYGGERFRICPPGLSSDELDQINSFLPSGKFLPQSFVAFLSAYRFAEFTSPLIEFYPTLEDGFNEITIPAMRFHSHLGLLAFATSENGGESFCLDFRSQKAPQVVLCRPGLKPGTVQIIDGMFSSFEILIRILHRAFEEPQSTFVEETKTFSNLEFFRSLAELDPEGFGGPGWTTRWSQWLIRDSVDVSSLPFPKRKDA